MNAERKVRRYALFVRCRVEIPRLRDRILIKSKRNPRKSALLKTVHSACKHCNDEYDKVV